MLGRVFSMRLGGLALGLAPFVVACTTQAPGDVDESASTIEGVVHVERTVGDDAATTSVSAKFMRLSPGDEAAAEDLVGSRVILPARGECAPVSSLIAGSLGAPKSAVELVDVGDLTLSSHADGAPVAVELAPRAFPDDGDLASGVFYTSPDSTLDLPAPARYTIAGTGASAVEPFSIDVDAPAAPARVRIDGRLLGARDTDAPTIDPARDALLEWDDGSAASSDSSEVMYVDLQGSVAYRCAFADTGAATLPADVVHDVLTSSVSGGAAPTSLSLSVHRVRDREVRVDLADREGEERALVRFDIARSGKVAVAPR